MKRMAILATVSAILTGCAGHVSAPFGKDISDMFAECQDGTLLGYDLQDIDVASLPEDFLSFFKSRSGYDLKEVWPQIDTMENRGKYAPYVLFDYRSAVVDLWRAGYSPAAGDVSPVNGKQRLLLLYSDVDLMRACAGDDSTSVNLSEKASARLAEKHFDFDFVSDTTVRAGIKVRGKHILSPGGVRYDALVVPGNREMIPATLASLLKVAEDGAAVLFESDVPLNVPCFLVDDKVGRMEEMLCGIGLQPWNDMYYAKYGRGHVVVSNDIIIALLSMGLKMK